MATTAEPRDGPAYVPHCSGCRWHSRHEWGWVPGSTVTYSGCRHPLALAGRDPGDVELLDAQARLVGRGDDRTPAWCPCLTGGG